MSPVHARVRLLSIPHSGTRTMEQILRNNRISYVQAHFTGEYDNGVIWDLPQLAIVVMRSTDKVVGSWHFRGKTGRKNDEKLYAARQELAAFLNSKQNICLIHMDRPELRDREIETVSVQLKLPVIADWSIRIGANGT